MIPILVRRYLYIESPKAVYVWTCLFSMCSLLYFFENIGFLMHFWWSRNTPGWLCQFPGCRFPGSLNQGITGHDIAHVAYADSCVRCRFSTGCANLTLLMHGIRCVWQPAYVAIHSRINVIYLCQAKSKIRIKSSYFDNIYNDSPCLELMTRQNI